MPHKQKSPKLRVERRLSFSGYQPYDKDDGAAEDTALQGWGPGVPVVWVQCC